jgi:hypothetical protein
MHGGPHPTGEGGFEPPTTVVTTGNTGNSGSGHNGHGGHGHD